MPLRFNASLNGLVADLTPVNPNDETLVGTPCPYRKPIRGLKAGVGMNEFVPDVLRG